jgi:hypothetical protein
MGKQTSVKHLSSFELQHNHVGVRPPFHLERDEQRQYVRLEIAAPVNISRIKSIDGDFWAAGEERRIEGTILNLSEGGVLVDTRHQLDSGDIVALQFTLQESESLDHVLGVVKRVEQDPDGCLTGIQFVDRQYLADKLSQGEIDLLPDKFDTFRIRVSRILQNYIYKVSTTDGVD